MMEEDLQQILIFSWDLAEVLGGIEQRDASENKTESPLEILSREVVLRFNARKAARE